MSARHHGRQTLTGGDPDDILKREVGRQEFRIKPALREGVPDDLDAHIMNRIEGHTEDTLLFHDGPPSAAAGASQRYGSPGLCTYFRTRTRTP